MKNIFWTKFCFHGCSFFFKWNFQDFIPCVFALSDRCLADKNTLFSANSNWARLVQTNNNCDKIDVNSFPHHHRLCRLNKKPLQSTFISRHFTRYKSCISPLTVASRCAFINLYQWPYFHRKWYWPRKDLSRCLILEALTNLIRRKWFFF